VLEPSQLSTASHGPSEGRHSVPAGAVPPPEQTGSPVAQLMVPASHVPGVTQAPPGTQTVQPPIPSQARPTPQVVPVGRSAVALHVPLPPPEQSFVPAVHGLPVSQLPPAMHSEQPSAPQRPATPQGVPTGSASVAMQTGIVGLAPQSISPRVQGSLVSQVCPATHMSQPVGEQASPMPHPVPGGWSALAMHERVLPMQTSTPELHGSPVSQVVPATHVLQMPSVQVPPPGHGEPFGASSASKQIGMPEPQSIEPREQGLPLSQVTPGVQTVHMPTSSHARPTSQGAPGGRSAPGTQVGEPPQLHVPAWQGFAGVHVVPSTHTAVSPSGRDASPGSRQKMPPPPSGGQTSVVQPKAANVRATKTLTRHVENPPFGPTTSK